MPQISLKKGVNTFIYINSSSTSIIEGPGLPIEMGILLFKEDIAHEIRKAGKEDKFTYYKELTRY